tara:strand:+ start:771 stop:1199 length:429 start_codon:yes stop_codon:yes gene_type:complete
MQEIFGLIAEKFSGEDFDADDLMRLMNGNASTSDSETEAKKKKKGGKAKKSKGPVDPNMPKKPASSYIMFCNETRGTKPNGDGKYSKSELTELWKDLDSDDRDFWQNKAKESRDKYNKDYKIWEQSKANGNVSLECLNSDSD